jgi:hypothetical protein
MDMQKLSMMVVLLCAIYNVHGAEIQYTTKKTEKLSLICKDDQPRIFHDKQLKSFFVKSIALLPFELQINILRNYFSNTREDAERNRNRFAGLSSGLVLKQYFRAQEICPITIGNKIFVWQDVIRLTKKQQDDLFAIGNPGQFFSLMTGYDNVTFGEIGVFEVCFGSNRGLREFELCCDKDAPRFKNLKKMPRHITEKLVIAKHKGCCCGESSCTVCVGICCLSSPIALAGATQLSSVGCCRAAAFLATVFGSGAATTSVGFNLFERWLVGTNTSKYTYEFDKEKQW